MNFHIGKHRHPFGMACLGKVLFFSLCVNWALFNGYAQDHAVIPEEKTVVPHDKNHEETAGVEKPEARTVVVQMKAVEITQDVKHGSDKKVVTLEERLALARKELEELGGTNDIGDGPDEPLESGRLGGDFEWTRQNFDSLKLRLRKRQVRELERQLEGRRRAKSLDVSVFSKEATADFQRRFRGYTAKKSDWSYNRDDIDFAHKLAEELREGRVNPNVEVVDARFSQYSGPILSCILSGRIQWADGIARELLKLGADVDVCLTGPAKERLINSEACFVLLTEGCIDKMEGFLLPFLAKPDFFNSMRQRSYSNLEELVAKLIYLKHNLAERDNQGNTPLHHAARLGSARLVALMLLEGANANAINENGETPLHLTARYGYFHLEPLLLLGGADPTLKTINGETVEDSRKKGAFLLDIENRKYDAVRKALENGMSPNIFGRKGLSMLQLSCWNNDAEMVRLLLEFHADVELTGKAYPVDSKPVAMAFYKNQIEIFETLLEKGANPNVNPRGYGGSIYLLQMLCDRPQWFFGPDEKIHLRALKALLNAKIPPRLIIDKKAVIEYALIERRDGDFVSMLLERYESFPRDSAVVACALVHGYPDSIVERLVEKQANVNTPYVIPKAEQPGKESMSLTQSYGGKEVTALWLAVKLDRPAIVRLLLKNGADANWRDENGTVLRELPCSKEIRRLLSPSDAGDVMAEQSVSSDKGLSQNDMVHIGARQENTGAAVTLEERLALARKELSEQMRDSDIEDSLLDLIENKRLGVDVDWTRKSFGRLKPGLRKVQIRELEKQLEVHRRAKGLDASAFSKSATADFQRRIGDYTAAKSGWGYNSNDIKFVDGLIAELRSGVVNPNVEVVDARHGEYSGPILSYILSKRIAKSKEIAQELLRQGADAEACLSMSKRKELLASDACFVLLTEGGIDKMEGFILPLLGKPEFYSKVQRIYHFDLEELVARLIYLKHNLAEKDIQGNTALHYAARLGSARLVTLMLLDGAAVNAVNTEGETPLHLALKYGHLHLEPLLMLGGASTEIRTARGENVEDYRKNALFLKGFEQKDYISVRTALKNGMNPNMFHSSGITLLQMACKNGDAEMVRLLLEFNADVELTGGKIPLDSKPISFAFAERRLDIVKMLLERGADPNANPMGTAGRYYLLNELCERFGQFDRTAGGHLIWLKTLLNARKPLKLDSYEGPIIRVALVKRLDYDFVSALLERYERFPQGSDVVACALFYGHPDSIVARIVEKGGDVNALFTIPEYRTILTVHPRRGQKTTALWLAVELDRPDVVKLLLKNGADVNWKDKNGKTVLELPCSAEISQLLRAFADRNTAAGVVIASIGEPSSRGRTKARPDNAGPAVTLDERLALARKELAEFAESGRIGDVSTELIEDKRFGRDVEWMVSSFDKLKVSLKKVQIRELEKQLDVYQRARNLDVSKFSGEATAEFQRRFKEYTIKRYWGGYQKDKDFSLWVVNELKKGLVNPNVEVVDSSYKEYSGPLLSCIFSGRIEQADEIARELLKLGANSDVRFSEPHRLLNSIAWNVVLEEGGIDRMGGFLLLVLGFPDFYRLCWPQRDSHLEDLAARLICLKHNLMERDHQGNAALHYAAKIGSARLVALMLLDGADVNVVNKAGETPLHLALKYGHFHLEPLLLKEGADRRLKTMKGETADSCRKTGIFLQDIEKKNYLAVRKALENGMDPNLVRGDNITILQNACRENDVKLARLLLEFNADIELAGTMYPLIEKPIAWAFNKKSLEVFELLLEKGADSNVNIFGDERESYYILPQLCEHERNMNESNTEKDLRWLNALLNAKKSPRLFMKNKEPVIRLALASRRDEAFISRLLDRYEGFPVGCDVIAMALYREYLDPVVKGFIEKGADVNAVFTIPNNSRTLYWGKSVTYPFYASQKVTALWLAVAQERPRIVELLLKKGADIHWKDERGRTVHDLHCTAEISQMLHTFGDRKTAIEPSLSSTEGRSSKGRKQATVQQVSAGPAVTLEERLALARTELAAQAKGFVWGLSSAGLLESGRLGNDIKWTRKNFNRLKLGLRKLQVRELERQLEVRRHAKSLDTSVFSEQATADFQRRFRNYTDAKSDWSCRDDDIKFGETLLAELQSRRVNPNVEVVDERYGKFKGPILSCILSGRIQKADGIARELLKLGADADVCLPKRERLVHFPAGHVVLAEGGIDRMEGFLLPLLAKPDFFNTLKRYSDDHPDDLVARLVYLKHNLREKDRQGNTPLHHAARLGSARLVALMLLDGAEVNAVNTAWETPLHLALKYGHLPLEPLLLLGGADSTVRTVKGEGIEDYRKTGLFFWNIARKNYEPVKTALENGMSPDIVGSDGLTLLQRAVWDNDAELVRLLLRFGADINLTHTRSQICIQPVSLALSRKNMDLFETLLEKGADPNVNPLGFGGSLLLLPVICERAHTYFGDDEKTLLRCLRALLNAKKKPSLLHERRPVLEIALQQNMSHDFVSMLLDRYERFPKDSAVVACALFHGYPDSIVERLIEKGADVNVPYEIPWLIWDGKDNQYMVHPLRGKSVMAIHLAKARDNPALVGLLLKNGADINRRSGKGQTVKEPPSSAETRRKIK